MFGVFARTMLSQVTQRRKLSVMLLVHFPCAFLSTHWFKIQQASKLDSIDFENEFVGHNWDDPTLITNN
jgi:hypothetical protein